MTGPVKCAELRCADPATEVFERQSSVVADGLPREIQLCRKHREEIRQGARWAYAEGQVLFGDDADLTLPKILVGYEATQTSEAELEPGRMEPVITVSMELHYLGTDKVEDVTMHLSVPTARELSKALVRLTSEEPTTD